MVQILQAERGRPPEFRIFGAQLRKLIRCEANGTCLCRLEHIGLSDIHTIDEPIEITSNLHMRDIVQLGDYIEIGAVERRIRKMRDHFWMANSDGATRLEEHVAIEAHILIGRSWIPILPVDTEIGFSLGKRFDSEYIWMARNEQRGNLKLIGSECSRDILCAGELAAIDPDIGAVVDAAEIQRHMS